VLHPGAIVKPDSVILELSDLQLQRDALDAEFSSKECKPITQNLKVQVNSELMNQKAMEASLRSDYEQAKIQHEVDEKLKTEGIASSVTARLSKVKKTNWQFACNSRVNVPESPPTPPFARLQAQESHVQQQKKVLYQLKKSQLDALMCAPASTECCNWCPLKWVST